MAENFVLQLLHHSDFEGNTNAIEDAPRLAALFDYFDNSYVGNTLKLSAGDNWIPSPWYSSQLSTQKPLQSALQKVYETYFGLSNGTLTGLQVSPGVIDQAILNILGIQVSALGNHDFDEGDGALARIIKMSKNSSDTTLDAASITNIGTLFPYISANLDFSKSSSLSDTYSSTSRPINEMSIRFNGNQAIDSASEIQSLLDQDRIAPATTIQVDGELIGIVGATTQRLAAISSPRNVTVIGASNDDMAILAQQVQTEVNALLAANPGMNKVILISHLQDYKNEVALAKLLSGVDIIIGGGSDAIFADQTDVLRAGHVASETYPLVQTGVDGKPVLLVNTDGQYQYLGRLVVEFNENGEVLPNSIKPADSGAYAATDSMIQSLYGSTNPYSEGSTAALVKQLADAVDGIIGAKIDNVAGFTNVYLNGERSGVRNQETNFGNLTADANLAAVRSHIEQNMPEQNSINLVSLKNGGGIRAGIGLPLGTSGPEAPFGGTVTQLDIETALAFNNGLALVETNAAGLVSLLEHGLANAGTTNGRFPQIGGFSLSYDTDRPVGNRIVSLQIDGQDGKAGTPIVVDGKLDANPEMRVNIATLDFLATNNGDGYPFKEVATKITPLVQTSVKNFDTPLAEQNALFKFMKTNFGSLASAYDNPDVGVAQDARLQNLDERQDTVLDDQLSAIQTSSIISGGLGTDTIVFDGNQKDYIVVRDQALVTIAKINQPANTTKFVNAERLKFNDGIVDLEFTTVQSQIATLYDKLVNRQADLDGFQFWAKSISNGNDIGDIAMGILASNEYAQATGHNVGSASVAQNINKLYQELYGREADSGGSTFWQSKISQGNIDLAGVAQILITMQDNTGFVPLAANHWDFFV